VGLHAGKDAAFTEYDRISGALLAAAREQEQRVTGAVNEAQLMVNIGTAALSSADPVVVTGAAAAVAATKRVVSHPAYPVTYCAVEFVPIPMPDVVLTMDNSAVVAGRVVAADVDMVRLQKMHVLVVYFLQSRRLCILRRIYSLRSVFLYIHWTRRRKPLLTTVLGWLSVACGYHLRSHWILPLPSQLPLTQHTRRFSAAVPTGPQ
jgi:fructose-specific component phosphotransferase system IIB-like protein